MLSCCYGPKFTLPSITSSLLPFIPVCFLVSPDWSKFELQSAGSHQTAHILTNFQLTVNLATHQSWTCKSPILKSKKLPKSYHNMHYWTANSWDLRYQIQIILTDKNYELHLSWRPSYHEIAANKNIEWLVHHSIKQVHNCIVVINNLFYFHINPVFTEWSNHSLPGNKVKKFCLNN